MLALCISGRKSTRAKATEKQQLPRTCRCTLSSRSCGGGSGRTTADETTHGGGCGRTRGAGLKHRLPGQSPRRCLDRVCAGDMRGQQRSFTTWRMRGAYGRRGWSASHWQTVHVSGGRAGRGRGRLVDDVHSLVAGVWVLALQREVAFQTERLLPRQQELQSGNGDCGVAGNGRKVRAHGKHRQHPPSDGMTVRTRASSPSLQLNTEPPPPPPIATQLGRHTGRFCAAASRASHLWHLLRLNEVCDHVFDVRLDVRWGGSQRQRNLAGKARLRFEVRLRANTPKQLVSGARHHTARRL
eukprot:354731-Chlamydomonas_euryale.AAC.1